MHLRAPPLAVSPQELAFDVTQEASNLLYRAVVLNALERLVVVRMLILLNVLLSEFV